ncbi:MAG: endoglycosylceramidase [Solirubrobacteraceae bacterium]|nr:endoglycosylceramidase [Solirubrobacteraceae bacterium]
MRRLSHIPTRTLALAVATVLAGLVAALALADPFASAPRSSEGLTVPGSGAGPPRLQDRQGRTVLLRGVAVTGLIRYAWDYAENPRGRDADFAEIAALGMDFVRLPVSWSAIEPSPGVIDAGYIAQIAGSVRAAERHGLRVVVDMHMDRYNARLAPGNEADGAPAWATLVPSSCPSAPSPDDCSRAAWESFWTQRQVAGRSLQQRYIQALLAVSRRLRGDPGLAGLELMNNPSSGGEPSPRFETSQLWPFYRRVIAALRSDGERLPLWIDRAASTEMRDTETVGLRGRLSGDANLVLAPHDYVGVFSKPDWPAGGVARLAAWYRDTVREATAQRMALVVGEWGAPAGGVWDELLSAKLGLQNAGAIGSSFWMWKQRPGFYGWNLVNLDGRLRPDTKRAQLLSVPYPQAVPGRIVSCAYAGGRLTVQFNGDRAGTALLWSGAQVLAGGTPGGPAPLTHATVDGRPVAVRLSPRHFAAGSVALAGDVVSVAVPAGHHRLVLG